MSYWDAIAADTGELRAFVHGAKNGQALGIPVLSPGSGNRKFHRYSVVAEHHTLGGEQTGEVAGRTAGGPAVQSDNPARLAHRGRTGLSGSHRVRARSRR